MVLIGRLKEQFETMEGLKMEKYFIINFKNGLIRIMYGTEEQAKEFCKKFGASYKEKQF
jgi:hypothetical protein